MLSVFIINILLGGINLGANEGSLDSDGKIIIQHYSADYPIEKLKSPDHFIPGSNKKEIPLKAFRDQVFSEAKIDENISSWDHFEKDMLYMRVKTYPVEKVIEIYPKINPSILKNLKLLIEKNGK